jgi:hypothetical protein
MLQRPPERRLLRALAELLVPGGQLRRVRTLRGGISAGTHRLTIQNSAWPPKGVCAASLR